MGEHSCPLIVVFSGKPCVGIGGGEGKLSYYYYYCYYYYYSLC